MNLPIPKSKFVEFNEGENVIIYPEIHFNGVISIYNIHLPRIFEEDEVDDFINQYVGIWEVMTYFVELLNAKKVTEIGTCKGYSTRIFSRALRKTGGKLISIDRIDHKIPRSILKTLTNVEFVKADIMQHDLAETDILYIDDWHNQFHLYEELSKFSSKAKVILIHDIMAGYDVIPILLKGVLNWCMRNFMPVTLYPLNFCGLAVIECEKFRGFYSTFKDKPTSKQ